MIRTIIIDDEKNNIEALKKMLTAYSSKIELIGTAENAEDAYKIIKQDKPQLIFLDIEMPFGNAFDLLEKLMPVDFEVIFFTAFDQYAIKAFKYGALDYLLKPVNVDDLDQAVHKAISRMAEKDINKRLDTFLTNMRSDDNMPKKIALPTRTGYSFENIDSITHLEASGTYTFLYLTDGRKEIISKVLKEFELLLPSTVFCRVHHSYIVNINYIKKYHKGRGGYIELHNGTPIEVSLRKKPDFLKKFGL
jgi:two-component system LytT family response regulator